VKGNPDEIIPALFKRTLERQGWTGPPGRIFTHLASLRRIRDRKGSVGELAPLSIFPFAPEDVTDLLLGQIDYISVLNADLLEAVFKRHGLRAEIASPPHHNDRFMRVTSRLGNHELTIQISASLREQMLIELMTPASLIAASSGLASELDDDPGPEGEGSIVAFADESRVLA